MTVTNAPRLRGTDIWTRLLIGRELELAEDELEPDFGATVTTKGGSEPSLATGFTEKRFLVVACRCCGLVRFIFGIVFGESFWSFKERLTRQKPSHLTQLLNDREPGRGLNEFLAIKKKLK